MFTFRKPTRATIDALRDQCRDASFNYPGVGSTRLEGFTPPPGYHLDQVQIELGRGQATYERARIAIQQWKMFPRSMVELFWPTVPVTQGSVVAVLFRGYGFWSLNSARIVYTVDETGQIDRYGFAYGTLPGHLESGEERFCVSWDHETDCVHYQINVFSRPNHWFVWLGYPVARREQARFRKLSAMAMKDFVG
jgi:uncharacterized protein (UPF0548 family)